MAAPKQDASVLLPHHLARFASRQSKESVFAYYSGHHRVIPGPRRFLILPLVRRLDLNIVLHEPWPSEQDMARFQSSCGIRDLRIHGINDSQNAPPADKFPALLHKLDVALYRGTSLLFRWLLSAREPPIFTTLVLGGRSAGEPMGPIHAYLRRFGSQIKSLSLGYWVDELIGGWSPEGTRAVEAHILAFTPRVVDLTLIAQEPKTIPATLLSLPSAHITTLEVGIYLLKSSPQPDWAAIDALLATPQFCVLQCLSFTNYRTKNSLITAEVKVLMPQTSARNILV
ncbi:hypothetical protein K438DRAFT_2147403 [Mycena galopus ATCC 62051]|nr:hypothetical protein K438DRAFT_2147403 [Mycena galopus ATCC 62051]